MSSFNLSSHSIRSRPWGQTISRVLAASLEAVDPYAAVLRSLARTGDRLAIAGETYDLRRYRRVLVVGAGKAGSPMARAAAEVLEDHLAGGIVIVKDGYTGGTSQIGPITLAEARHPLPDERGVQHTGRLLKLVGDAGPEDLVICLISGGGSALLLSPAEGLQLSDLQELTSGLLASGANINEINCLRKHLDSVKGGGLARKASPATLVTLILSDVVGDPLDVIASGPTVPDPTTYAEAYQVLERYSILDRVPAPVVALLKKGERGELPETPKPGDPLFTTVQNLVVGSNLQAAQAALSQAGSEGLQGMLLTTFLQGEARQAGRSLGAIARQISATGHPLPRPACIVAGGETTVTLKGDGLGGRNQELALGAVNDLAGLPDLALVTLATDGGDGPTDAAGAVVTGETLRRAKRVGLVPEDYLARNDSYHFFSVLDDLLRPGPTQTNVNDLTFIFAF